MENQEMEMEGQQEEAIETNEAKGLQMIIELAKTGSPQALGKIGQIATDMLKSQSAEMAGMEEQVEEKPQSFNDKLSQAYANEKGGANE